MFPQLNGVLVRVRGSPVPVGESMTPEVCKSITFALPIRKRQTEAAVFHTNASSSETRGSVLGPWIGCHWQVYYSNGRKRFNQEMRLMETRKLCSQLSELTVGVGRNCRDCSEVLGEPIVLVRDD